MDFNKILKKSYPSLIAFAIFCVSAYAFFSPQLEGKRLDSHDSLNHRAAAREIQEYKKSSGETILWTNTYFGGMPTYQMGVSSKGNVLFFRVYRSIQNFFGRPAFFVILACLSLFTLLKVLKVNHWLALIGGLAYGFSTYHFLNIEAGHATKEISLGMFPFLISGCILVMQHKKYLFGGVVAAFSTSLMMGANHPQIVYYGLFSLLILGLVYMVKWITEKDYQTMLKATAVLLVAGLLGVLTNSTILFPTQEYAKETIRGKKYLKSQTDEAENEGLSKGYVFSWSQGFLESFSMLVPNVVGGSSTQPLGANSEFVDLLRQSGRSTKEARKIAQNSPTYWGAMPSTGGPPYAGAIVLFLFVFAAFYVKGPLKWWLVASTILYWLVSMGDKIFLGDILFNYLPMFDKFRAPVMIMNHLIIMTAVLSMLGLNQLISAKKLTFKSVETPFYAALGIVGGLCLFFAIIGPGMLSFEGPSDSRLAQNGILDAIEDDRVSILRADAFRSLLFVLIGAGLIFGFVKQKLKLNLLLPILAVVVLIDLIPIAKRYITKDDYVKIRDFGKDRFTKSAADIEILKDKDPHYRVLNAGKRFDSDGETAYYHKSINGYHGAKLRRIQDLADNYIFRTTAQFQQSGDVNVLFNSAPLNMLNTKYIIAPTQQGERSIKNPNNFGDAWFAGSVVGVNSPNEEMAALGKNDLKNAVIIDVSDNANKSYLGGKMSFGSGGKIQLTKYHPEEMTYTASANSEVFAVFPEIYYNSKKGWNAYLDGKKVNHIRVNYLLRGMILPKGNHTVEFKFEPKVYHTSLMVSRIALIVIGLLLVYLIIKSFKVDNKKLFAKQG